jgi:hypothetical protein
MPQSDLTVWRNLRLKWIQAFIRLLDTVAQRLRATAKAAECTTAVGQILWTSLGTFRTPHAYIVDRVIQTALKFRYAAYLVYIPCTVLLEC